MSGLIYLVALQSDGQIAKIARTFGVDWPHLLAQIVSFSIMCVVLYLWAYKPVLKMLEDRRQVIALGQANAEQIRAELARTESMRQEVIAKANAEATRSLKRRMPQPPAFKTAKPKRPSLGLNRSWPSRKKLPREITSACSRS